MATCRFHQKMLLQLASQGLKIKRSSVTSSFTTFDTLRRRTSSKPLTSSKSVPGSNVQSRGYAKMLADPENKGSRQDHVNFDTLGTWDNRIDFPMLLQQSIKHGKPIPKITLDNVGSATVVGRRNYNEDRFAFKELAPNLLYFGVFDGHGGSLCADFVCSNLQLYIKYWLQEGENDLQTILENSFIEINNAFARYVTFNHSGSAEALSGTTATVALLRNSHELVLAHVGDSRAMICRNGEPIRLTTDHCAHQLMEKERILRSGGTINPDSVGRILVNKRLAMTRSLGDLDLKPFGVTAQPDTKSIEIKHGRDSCLILTTDGINFVMNDQEVVNAVNSCKNPQESAHLVVDQALNYACEDNATALVIPFGAWGKYRNNHTNQMSFYSFGRELSKSARHG